MALDKTSLKQKLQEFCDPDYQGTPPSSPAFGGYPANRGVARAKWAAAFFAYIDKGSESVNVSGMGHPALSMTSVESDFKTDLDLNNSISAEQAAADFAGAWKKAVDGITALATTTDGSATYSLFEGFSGTTSQHDTLRDALKALFEKPTISVAQRLEKIADAFDAATKAIKGKITKTTNATPPVTSKVDVSLV
jgi:hypothetical protein